MTPVLMSAMGGDASRLGAGRGCTVGAVRVSVLALLLGLGLGTAGCACVPGHWAGGTWSPAPVAVAPAGPEAQVAYVAGQDVRVGRLGEAGRTIGAGFDPQLSPDGTRIAWMAPLSQQDVELRVADVATGATLFHASLGWTSPAWSPDGRLLAMATKQGLTLVDIASGARREVEVPDGWEAFDRPTWSPDGRRLAAGLLTPSRNGIAVVDVVTGDAAPLELPSDAFSPAWGRRGLAYATPARELYLVSEPGDAPQRLDVEQPDARGLWSPLAWSADGTRLLLLRGCWHGCTAAGVLDLVSGAVAKLGVGTPMAISADGRRVLLQDGCDSGVQINPPPTTLRVVASDGSGELERLDGAGPCGASWSPAPGG